MKITVLPTDLKVDNTSPIQIFNYYTFNDLHRGKIIMEKNVISFLLHGSKEVFGDSEPIPIDGSKFIIVKSGNCLMTEQVSTINKSYKSILFFFSDEVVVDFLERQKLNTSKGEQEKSFYIYKYDTYIKLFVESLEKILTLNKQLQKRLLQAKFDEIMLYMIEKEGKGFLNTLFHLFDDSKTNLTKIVESNKLKRLTLQELSFLCNMSLSTFKREFFKHYNFSPIKWFQERRLEHAALLLRAQKKRPIELYEEAGYETLSSFIQAFKKKYGITPKQFQLEN